MLRQIIRQIIQIDVSDTRKLEQAKVARQSWSCSMEYSSFVYVYQRRLWIMRYISLAYRRCWLQQPEAEDRLCGFQSHFFSKHLALPWCTSLFHFCCYVYYLSILSDFQSHNNGLQIWMWKLSRMNIEQAFSFLQARKITTDFVR